jgi:hypothetical protein
MRRRDRSRPHLDSLDAGLALLGVEVLRRAGLPCPSDAEVLGVRGAPADAAAVESEAQFLREKISGYLVQGMLLDGLQRRAAAGGR